MNQRHSKRASIRTPAKPHPVHETTAPDCHFKAAGSLGEPTRSRKLDTFQFGQFAADQNSLMGLMASSLH